MASEKRLIALTDKQILALKAVAYGCNKNKRLVGASYISDISSAKTQDISFYEALTVVYAILDEMEVVHGRWFDYDNDPMWQECSACGYRIQYSYSKDCNYCPNCGAKMVDASA